MGSLYEFKEEDAYRFRDHVGAVSRKKGYELSFEKCPYCGGNAKDKYTFSINLQNGKFNCLRSSCGQRGNMIRLSSDFGFTLSDEVNEWILSKNRTARYGKFKKPKSANKAIAYLKERGISRSITEKYGIATKKDDDKIMIFQFADENGNVQMLKFRNMEFKKGDYGSKEWCDKDAYTILFGMQHCDPDLSDTLVITEGQIDSLSVAEAGIPNAVSVPTGAKGFTWYPRCFDFLARFKKIIIFGDHENGKISLLEEMRLRLGDKILQVREEDYCGCKDANEILINHGKDAIKKAVENAIQKDDDHILRVSTVKQKNLADLECIKSGITPLDNVIGGFYLGQVSVLTGKRGNGKSTLASQIVTNAIGSGFNTFCYSAEIADWQFKNWIDRQFAGADRVRLTDDKTDYVTEDSTVMLLNEWYKDKLFLFNNAFIDEDDPKPLLDIMKNAAVMHDCRLFLIDNMMTAMSDDYSLDIYREQSNFMKELVRFAAIYNVHVILIAHPRKTSTEKEKSDDVAGSSNITNLAHLVINFYKRDVEKNKDGIVIDDHANDRVIHVLKNRNTGKLTGDSGITVWYQETSKRFCSLQKWETNFDFVKDEFEEVEDEWAIPFDFE